MTREYHLILPESDHPAEDWTDAVNGTEGVRLIDDSTLSTDDDDFYVTGPLIDAEVFFPKPNEWKRLFRWKEGRASIAANFTPGDESHPAWWAVSRLAHNLHARLCDDFGNEFDTTTGKIVSTGEKVPS